MKKQYLVIGLGRFGTSVAKTLYNMDEEIMVIDYNKEKVTSMIEYSTYALEADVINEHVLSDLGVKNFDAAIIAIGENLQASILATIKLKELGVKNIICKAKDEVCGNILMKVGADRIIYPERDMGIMIAKNLLLEDK